MPVLRAADSPLLASWRKEQMRGSANAAATCGVSSAEQSSTIRISKSWQVCARTLFTARGSSAARLCVGMMTLTLGGLRGGGGGGGGGGG